MGVQIGRLTVGGDSWPRIGAEVLRLRAQAYAAALDVVPAGLPDRSTLVVRRLVCRADPVLGPSPAARRAATDLLTSHQRTAARPAHGADPADEVEAVLFSDEAELLACLTVDLVQGLAGRWYWQVLVPGPVTSTATVLTHVWVERARWLPAMVVLLPPPVASRAVQILSRAQQHRVLDALLDAYAVPLTGRPTGADLATAAQEPPPPPWAGYLHPSWAGADLEPVTHAVLGLATLLRQDGAAARRSNLGPRVLAWLDQAERTTPGTSGATGGQRTSGGEEESRLAPVAAADRSQPDLRVRLGAPVPAPPPGSDTPPVVGHSRPGQEADRELNAAVPRALVPDTGQIPAPTGREERSPAGPWSSPDVTIVRSQYASALFLVNILVWLDLPASWPGETPRGWRLVELAVRALLGDGVEETDPLWAVLADLDERDPHTPVEPVGASDLPVVLPEAWLLRWAPGPYRWFWQAAHFGVSVHDERGFVVADLPCADDRRRDVIEAYVARFRAAGPQVTLGPPRSAQPAADPRPATGRPGGDERWSDCVGSFLRWLLRERSVGESVLMQPGLVAFNRTHVDVLLDLDTVDLDARVAGLDRDPSWVPDLGRVVAFHFESAVAGHSAYPDEEPQRPG